ncbi:hypothetical protein D9D06_04085 [Pseudomonas aeruginosa]|nr:hypothetical protein D9D06_04085 [Pseudomonas aeruginosa]
MQAFEREVDAGDAGPTEEYATAWQAVPPGRSAEQAATRQQERQTGHVERAAKRWRQASLIVFATTVILILPNLNSLIR